jgi:hypothetical protein
METNLKTKPPEGKEESRSQHLEYAPRCTKLRSAWVDHWRIIQKVFNISLLGLLNTPPNAFNQPYNNSVLVRDRITFVTVEIS